MPQQNLKLALLQMDVVLGKPDVNIAKLNEMLEQALSAATKPDIIMFPELWNTGFALDQIHLLADENGEQTKQMMSAFSRKYQVNIVAGSIAEKKGADVFNTTYVFDRDGNVSAEYSKIHLFRLMDEEKYLVSGEDVGSVQMDGNSAGLIICYDLRFPELSRHIALGGAKMMLVPAQWPHPRLHHWRTLLTARAIENQMFVISCNRVGQSGETSFFGHSMVVDPWGEIIVEGGEAEAILTAEIDLSVVDNVRRTIPIFEDRRPSLY